MLTVSEGGPLGLSWEEAEEKHPGCSVTFEWSGLADVPVTLRDSAHFEIKPFPADSIGSDFRQRLMACPLGEDIAFYGPRAEYRGSAVFIDELCLWVRCTAYFDHQYHPNGLVWPPPREDICP